MPDKRAAAIDDPLQGLPLTAQRIVAAARRLLAREGFEALTVDRVAVEAGEYKDAVRYYFGSKAGMIAAVVGSMAHDSSLDSSLKTRDLPPGEQRVRALLEADRRLAEDVATSRDFLSILPHVLRDDDLRSRVARLYEWYRDLYVRCFSEGLDEAQLHRLALHAGLMVAMIDGLAIQKALDPDIDLGQLFDLWIDVVGASLEHLV
jgi:AcrR family transcriptional regulator